MAFITRTQLESINVRPERVTEARSALRKTASVNPSVFVSHSHSDRDLIGKVVELLLNAGADGYVDWLDEGMPTTTSEVTALALRQKMRQADKLLLVATDRALQSRWVPWELGYFDGKRGIDSIAIMPVTVASAWTGSEYIGVYARLIFADNGKLAVFPAGKTQGALLHDWLKSK